MDGKRLRIQRLAGCFALPLLLVSGWLLVTDRGPSNLGMALLLAANAVMLTGLALAVWLHPKPSRMR